METTKRWVAGFLFREGGEVALVAKTHPEWQAGKLNGVGGKVEEGESTLEAMKREFEEEAGATIDDWREFAIINVEAGAIHFFAAHGDVELKSLTEEVVSWHPISELATLPVIPNLRWLIPLALDAEPRHAVVSTRSGGTP